MCMCIVQWCIAENQKGQQKDPIFQKTTGLYPSRSYYFLNSWFCRWSLLVELCCRGLNGNWIEMLLLKGTYSIVILSVIVSGCVRVCVCVCFSLYILYISVSSLLLPGLKILRRSGELDKKFSNNLQLSKFQTFKE